MMHSALPKWLQNTLMTIYIVGAVWNLCFALHWDSVKQYSLAAAHLLTMLFGGLAVFVISVVLDRIYRKDDNDRVLPKD